MKNADHKGVILFGIDTFLFIYVRNGQLNVKTLSWGEGGEEGYFKPYVSYIRI